MSEQSHERAAATLGMWLFLFSEILLFGGLFVLYAVYRRHYPLEFHASSGLLDLPVGAANTVILLTSSLAVVLALAAIRRGSGRQARLWLGGTAGLGAVFLVNKLFEWREKFSHHLYPNSPEWLTRPQGDSVFFSLYFFMTGLHAIHVLIGLALILVVMHRLCHGRLDREHHTLLFNVGLYWHLVDVIWIYLFPLFYLIS